MSRTFLYMLSVLLVALYSCNASRDEAFTFQPIPSDGWEQTDTLRFPIDSLQQGGTFLLYINLRTSVSNPYPFRNISLSLQQRWKGEPPAAKHLEYTLLSSHGSTISSGVSYHQMEFPADTITLKARASGELLISHQMRSRILHGISDVGIRLSRLR